MSRLMVPHPLNGDNSFTEALDIQRRAAAVGFDWPNPLGIFDKLHEETREAAEAFATGGQQHLEREIGDLLFTVVNLARAVHTDPARALSECVLRFSRRFDAMLERLAARGLSPGECTLEEMDKVWDEVKQAEPPA